MCKSDEAILAAVLTGDDEIYLGRVRTAAVGGKAGVEVTLPGKNGGDFFLPARSIDLIRPLADEGEFAAALGRVADAESYAAELEGLRSVRRRADERDWRLVPAGEPDAVLQGGEHEIPVVVRAGSTGNPHSYAGWLATVPGDWLPGFLALRIPSFADVPDRRLLLNPALIHSVRLVDPADLPALVAGFATPDEVDEYLSYCDAGPDASDYALAADE